MSTALCSNSLSLLCNSLNFRSFSLCASKLALGFGPCSFSFHIIARGPQLLGNIHLAVLKNYFGMLKGCLGQCPSFFTGYQKLWLRTRDTIYQNLSQKNLSGRIWVPGILHPNTLAKILNGFSDITGPTSRVPHRHLF